MFKPSWQGSVELCRHNFEHEYYIWSLRHNAGIICTNIFSRIKPLLLGKKNCEMCMQNLPATRSRMYKVDKSGNILGT